MIKDIFEKYIGNITRKKCKKKNRKKMRIQYTHVDTIKNVTITNTSNPDVNTITHVFDLENTKQKSEIYLTSTVYRNDNILTNINNLNTIKINDVGCINFIIPLFNVNFDNLWYINGKDTSPIISEITSGSGKFANIKGYVKTTYKKDKCFMTIVYRYK